MLSPEIFNWPPTQHTIQIKIGDKEFVNKCVNNKYFNHAVTLVVPDTLSPPDEFVSKLTVDTMYYHVTSLPVHELVHSQFIKQFIRTGCVSLLSVDTKIDQDDCCAVTPSGHIVLSLVKESFQGLGLEGVRSRFSDDRFIVNINLATMVTSGKMYERITRQLKSAGFTFNVIVAWEPHDETLCPSNIAEWFCSASYSVRKCNIVETRDTAYNMSVPDLDQDQVPELLEWVGMLVMDCKTDNVTDIECALSTYQVPEPSTHFPQVSFCTWTGFFSSNKVMAAVEQLRSWTAQKSSSAWVCLTVHGFDDSPLSWGMGEHTVFTEGDNNYSIFLSNHKPTIAVSYNNSSKSARKTFVPRSSRRKKRSNEKRSKRLQSLKKRK